jgi:hypothetical protein
MKPLKLKVFIFGKKSNKTADKEYCTMNFLTKRKLFFLLIAVSVLAMSSLTGKGVVTVSAEVLADQRAEAFETEFIRGILNFVDISRKTVVINDQSFLINKHTRFYSSSGAAQTINGFHRNEVVEYKATDDMILTEMRSSKKGNAISLNPVKRSDRPSTRSSAGNQTIRLENGTWTN